MKDFKKYSGGGKSFNDKGGYSGSKGGYSGDKSYGGSNSRSNGGAKPSYHKSDMTMYDATCSDCGNACQVPFRPVGSKPIKCRNCFVDKREGQDHTFSNKYSQERREGKSVGKSEGATLSVTDQKAISDMKVQIDSLHTKINSIMEILNK